MREVELWTDGSSTGAVGDGGWAYVLVSGELRKEGSGYVADTTNNRMEMTALLMGLRALKTPCKVNVHIDSEYVMKGFTEGRISKWQQNGWITGRGKKKKPVANQDIWMALKSVAVQHRLNFTWVRGHSEIELNERCDVLAKEAKAAGPDAWVHVELPPAPSLELEFAS